jgi:hypothetical protein|tara:strand:- start:294 stop:548 length:255 start_codon:yes stop_codon:yes gene_type:complete
VVTASPKALPKITIYVIMDGYVNACEALPMREKNDIIEGTTVSLYRGDKRIASNLRLMEAFKQAREYLTRGIRVDIVRENLGES